MKYLKEYTTYKYGEKFKPGDLVKYTDFEEDDFIYKVYAVDHTNSLCLQIAALNDDGSPKYVMGWYRENNFEPATQEDFEDWKMKRDSKKYNL